MDIKKIDPYNHQKKYENWKKKVIDKIKGLSKSNSDIIKNYIFDMENGINIAIGSAKGARSYPRLNNLRQRITFLAKEFEIMFKMDMTELGEKEVIGYFNAMRTGKVKKRDGGNYKSAGNYVDVFKAFWHWHMKVNRKNNIEIKDITLDLDNSTEKPKWVYLTFEQVKIFADKLSYFYRVLVMFLFCSGVRSPTELTNIYVSDLRDDKDGKLILDLREIASKTFGRKIKLMLCSEILKEYIKTQELKPTDRLFPIKFPSVINRYLKNQAKKVFGEGVSEAGEKFCNLTMYDFRHCSCCYWLLRYKSESALKYRFGWKKSEKIHYYSEFLGMKDTITEDDMLIDTTKTELEKNLHNLENENNILKERLAIMEVKMGEIENLTDIATEKLKNKPNKILELEQENKMLKQKIMQVASTTDHIEKLREKFSEGKITLPELKEGIKVLEYTFEKFKELMISIRGDDIKVFLRKPENTAFTWFLTKYGWPEIKPSWRFLEKPELIINRGNLENNDFKAVDESEFVRNLFCF